MAKIIDLDAMDPKAVTIKLDGQEYQVEPPKTVDILRLGYFTSQLTEVDQKDEVKLQEAVTNLTEHVYKCIPGISGKHLSKVQLQKLVDIITEMAMPTQNKELEDRGITPDANEKKASEG